MNNTLAVAAPSAQQPIVPLQSVQDLQALGTVLAQSKMFGSETNPAQGLVIVGMCQQEGISWAKWSQTYNLIHGQVSKRTDAMLADFQRMGGRHKVIRRDSEGASVGFDFDGTTYVSTCLWEDIKGESFTLSPKTGKLKDKYATPRSRMQMLWARAVSDGLRVVCPMCCQGVYTPEEVSDFTETDGDAPARYSQQGTGRTPLAAPPASTSLPTADAASASLPAASAKYPTVAETVVGNEPTPFEDAADSSVCPIPGKLFGKPWDTMDDSVLTMALNFTPEQAPTLTDAHRDAIRAVLAARMNPSPAQEEPANA